MQFHYIKNILIKENLEKRQKNQPEKEKSRKQSAIRPTTQEQHLSTFWFIIFQGFFFPLSIRLVLQVLPNCNHTVYASPICSLCHLSYTISISPLFFLLNLV